MLWILFSNLLVPVTCLQTVPVLHRDVSTTQGLVRGYQVQPNYYAYMGIPYAQTSANSRFQAPQPPRRWDSIFEATHRITCFQSDGTGEENCLVINVFTPLEGTSLPVLVYVHGGDFQNGWGPADPMKPLIQNDIIIVTFNYRLGALGFLCLAETEASGNAGLKDQVAALYWIHRNIAHFGGNPSDVTLYGTESGAVSIQLLLISGIMEGLFQRVIMEAGSILSPNSMRYDSVIQAFDAAKSLGYKGVENAHELAKFFQNLSVRHLLNTTEYFLPCIENKSYFTHSLLDLDPVEILKQGYFQNIPMIIVYSDRNFLDSINTMDRIPENFENILPNNLEFHNDKVRTKVAELVKEFYFRDKADIKTSFENYLKDILIEYPIVKMAVLFAVKNSQPVFIMKFSHDVIKHGKTSKSGFGYENIADLLYAKDYGGNAWVKEIVLTLWSNFIQLGDPTPIITASTPVIWQPIATSSPDGRVEISFISQLFYDGKLKLRNAATSQIVFWNRIYEKFYKVHSNPHNESDYV